MNAVRAPNDREPAPTSLHQAVSGRDHNISSRAPSITSCTRRGCKQRAQAGLPCTAEARGRQANHWRGEGCHHRAARREQGKAAWTDRPQDRGLFKSLQVACLESGCKPWVGVLSHPVIGWTSSSSVLPLWATSTSMFGARSQLPSRRARAGPAPTPRRPRGARCCLSCLAVSVGLPRDSTAEGASIAVKCIVNEACHC